MSDESYDFELETAPDVDAKPLHPATDDGTIGRLGHDVVIATTWWILCMGAGIVGSLPLADAGVWYGELDKPFFTPPAALFAPIWTLLYTAMAFGAWRVTRAGVGMAAVSGARREALMMFSLHLALNMAWQWAFFGARSPWLALVVMAVMIDNLRVVIRQFGRIDAFGALMLVPYFVWLSFEALLNLGIVLAN